MDRPVRIAALATALLLLTAAAANAYMVAYALPCDQLVEESSAVLKATVIGSRPIDDPWFPDVAGYRPYETEMKVISVIKGEVGGDRIRFRHYGTDPTYQGGLMYMPQWYDLKPGRSYIVFADGTGEPGVYRQLWKSHRMKEDQGVVMTGSDLPVPQGMDVKGIIWLELTTVLEESSNPADIVYAIGQLHEMAGGGHTELKDFDRARVANAVAPLLDCTDPDVAREAIRTVGAGSPYLDDWNAAHWLATVGHGSIEGLALREKDARNQGAADHWKQLVAVAEADRSTEIRSTAILALGRSMEPALYSHIKAWAGDKEPEIRKAAAILLADYPGTDTVRLLRTLAEDESPLVRFGAMRGIGFGQIKELLPVLEDHLDDAADVPGPGGDVRTAAALSILSFGPEAVLPFLQARKDNAEFKSVFVNRLAEKNPEPYLDDLREIIAKQMEPTHFWGGQIPSYTSWKILFDYLKSQRADALKSGRFDASLDALEAARVHSSSEPRDLYALYLDRGLIDRAKRFRERCKTAVPFDMEIYFDRVDKEHAAGGK